jgi:hypothetical protein
MAAGDLSEATLFGLPRPRFAGGVVISLTCCTGKLSTDGNVGATGGTEAGCATVAAGLKTVATGFGTVAAGCGTVEPGCGTVAAGFVTVEDTTGPEVLVISATFTLGESCVSA